MGRPSPLPALVADLKHTLIGAVVQKLWGESPARLFLELRQPGQSTFLYLDASAPWPVLAAVEYKPKARQNPPGWQHVFRQALTGCKLQDAQMVQNHVSISWVRPGLDEPQRLTLHSEPRAWVMTTGLRKILSVATSRRREGLRNGEPYVRLEVPDSQLRTLHQGEENLRQAGQRIIAQQQRQETEDQTKAAQKQLRALRKTIVKVHADLARIEQSEKLREHAEWLVRHSAQVQKGATQVKGEGFSPQGDPVVLQIMLNPALSAAQNAERFFHQYRRLKRGAAIAQQRLEELQNEERQWVAHLSDGSRPAPATSRKNAPAAKSENAPPAAPPYREYQSAAGQKLWVGKGAKKNDLLTFQVAQPHHYWVHARGVSGAHVIIVVDKKQPLRSEDLIDAAHLAVYHSESRGQDKAEVSYTQVKYLRKPKGSAPGIAVLSKEQTLLLRVDADRLKLLLETSR